MDALKYPRGLIKYTSEHAIEHKKSSRFTLKNIGYAVALLIVSASLIFSITGRELIEMHVEQIRQPLYVVLSDGRVQNRYSIKVINKSDDRQQFKISLQGMPDAQLEVRPSDDIIVESGKSVSVQAGIVIASVPDVKQVDFKFILEPVNDPDARLVQNSSFFFPD